MLESTYMMQLKVRIQNRFPDCMVLRNDSRGMQGIPDLLVLYRDRWAMLEVKAYEGAPEQANQNHYINLFAEMSFGAFIYPENEEVVLDALQQAFGFGG